MTQDKKRVRMFAGPNGSGKSTIKASINPGIFGIYINPDEIEKEIRERGFLGRIFLTIQGGIIFGLRRSRMEKSWK